MDEKTDPRHQSRRIALSVLYQRAFEKQHKTDSAEISPETVAEQLGIDADEYDEGMVESIVDGVYRNMKLLDERISKYAPKWPIHKIPILDLQILRIGIYEGFVAKSVPPRVAINEAIELAKEYGSENTPAFVNGVLGAIYDDEKQKRDEKND